VREYRERDLASQSFSQEENRFAILNLSELQETIEYDKTQHVPSIRRSSEENVTKREKEMISFLFPSSLDSAQSRIHYDSAESVVD